MQITVTQAKGYTGRQNEKYYKELSKLTKKFMKMGKTEEDAKQCAESIMIMYAHHHDYRETIK